MDRDGELDASGLSFYHELIYGFELGIVPHSHGLGLNVWHCDGASVLEVLDSWRDEDA